MNIKAEIDQQSLQRLNDRLQQRLTDKTKALKDRLVQIGFEIQALASIYCPVRTGRLRSSISVVTREQTINQSGDSFKNIPTSDLEVWVGTPVQYATFVEFGTSKMTPRPFLRPAFYQVVSRNKK